MLGSHRVPGACPGPSRSPVWPISGTPLGMEPGELLGREDRAADPFRHQESSHHPLGAQEHLGHVRQGNGKDGHTRRREHADTRTWGFCVAPGQSQQRGVRPTGWAGPAHGRPQGQAVELGPCHKTKKKEKIPSHYKGSIFPTNPNCVIELLVAQSIFKPDLLREYEVPSSRHESGIGRHWR